MRLKPDRHRAVQVRRVQVQRLDQARAQPRLLEAGAALSRRHRVAHRFQSRNPHPGLCRRRGRLHVRRRRVSARCKADRPAGPQSDLRVGRRRMSPRTCLSTATRRRSAIPEIRRAMMLALDRQGFNDIIHEGKALISGAMLPAAVRKLGHAAGGPECLARLQRRPGSTPGRGAQDHGEPRVWPGQAAQGQGLDPRLAGLPRPGRHPRRPAQQDPLRCRAGGHRVLGLVRPHGEQEVRGRAQPDRCRRR